MQDELSLQVGKDISTAAHIRLRRAARLYDDLQRLVEQWRTSRPMHLRRHFSSDRRTATVYAPIARTLDLDDLSATYSDILHNAWAAHDHLFHDLLRLPGITAPNGRHYFPARDSEEQWQKFADRYHMLPAVLLERIRRLQPFTDRRRDGSTDRDYIASSALYATKERDTAYKHYAPPECVILRHEFFVGPLRWEGGGYPRIWGAPADSDPFADRPFRRVTVRDGASIRSYPIGVGVQLCARNPDTNSVDPLLQSAALALVQTEFNIDAICLGFDAARARAAHHDADALHQVWYDARAMLLDD